MELFVHRQGTDVELREVGAEATPAALIEQLGLSDVNVWLEEQDEPLMPENSLQEQGVESRSNVHVGKCKRVNVSVRFEAATKDYETRPAATLRSVYNKATSEHDGFDFSEHDKAQYTLQIRGTVEQPELSRHVGVFANSDCAGEFDLVLQKRFQGA